MQEQSRYVAGIDVGTRTVRCVVGYVGESGLPKIVGVGTADNSGMRKGMVSKLTGPAAAIDKALEVAERMSGHQVNEAVLSINGSHILSTKADGMITVGTNDSEVVEDDLYRIEEVATTGEVPANREILEVVPHAYRLDGQDNIKDPIGMSGARLELRANVISALAPYITNLRKSAEMANVEAVSVSPSVLAAARAVLSEQQLENGVAVLDIGASTTGVAVFEEGDLQYISVIPMGSQNVTNDLAIGLKTDPEIAEEVKLAHAKLKDKEKGKAEIKHNKSVYSFDKKDIEEIVTARYEEIFELVSKELKKAGGIGRLPSGVVLVGGGSKISGIVDFAKDNLGIAAKLGAPKGYAGAGDEVQGPDFAAAVGLMLMDCMGNNKPASRVEPSKATKKTGGLFSRLLAIFK